MSLKRTFTVIAALSLTLSCAGCGGNTGSSDADNSRTVVTMMYSEELESFEALVESVYDDIDLRIELSTVAALNSDSERRLKNGHGTDIIITNLPTGDVKDYTLDLSAEIFADRYQSTIMKKVMLDGETHYLPLPNQYSGYILNRTLTEKLTDKLPQTNDELIALMDKAAEEGIGIGEDGILFGLTETDIGQMGKFFLSLQIPDFLSQMDGIQWTNDFKDGKATFSGAWDNSLDWFMTIVDKGYFNPHNYRLFATNAMPVMDRMLDGTMLLCYGDMNKLYQLNSRSDEYAYTMIPILSSEGNGSWLTSSPDGYIAINKALDDEEKSDVKDAALRVLELFSTEDGQRAWINDTSATTSYLMDYKNTDMEIPDAISECVEERRVYTIQLPSRIVYNYGSVMLEVMDGSTEMSDALAKLDDYVVNGTDYTDYDMSIVGTLANDLLYENNNTRFRETEIGNLVADAMAELMGTQLAFANGGSIRASLYKGDVHGYDLEAVCPYSNHILSAEVTGEVIVEMLQNGISMTVRDGDVPAGRFLQVSGLRYAYRPMTEDTEAELLYVTLSDGTPIEADKTYTIAISDYMAGASGYLENNGDGYTMLNLLSDDVPKAENVRLIEQTDFTYADAVRKYFDNHKNSVIEVKCEGRIVVEDGTE